VLFSCKITHSVITYLDRRGEDLDRFYESCDWPAEFLRDPSSWLEADKMERVLKHIDQEYGKGLDSEFGVIEQVGHQCKDLRSWGVLDSVLRMVPASKDFFAQPERFLSYFVSPAPPIGDIIRENDRVSFVLPISDMQFPFVTSYLRAALEALPTYIGKPLATVTWDNSRVTIAWTETQASLFGEAEQDDLSLNPELVRSVLHDLETRQKELEETKIALIAKDREIERLRSALAAPRGAVLPKPVGTESSHEASSSLKAGEKVEQVLHDLFRLGDYVARGQQLITLLVGQGRQTPQVQEAMRRVDWEFVAVEGPAVVKNAVSELQKLRSTP
jgi:hypothetical protein